MYVFQHMNTHRTWNIVFYSQPFVVLFYEQTPERLSYYIISVCNQNDDAVCVSFPRVSLILALTGTSPEHEELRKTGIVQTNEDTETLLR